MRKVAGKLVSMKKPKDVMLELAAYFSSLHTGEVMFVQALVASALDHHPAEQGKSHDA